MNIRYFEKRGGAWHLDIRTPDGRRLRPYGGTSEAAARKEEFTILARILASNASASASVVAVKASGRTLEDAYKLALTTRESWITSKSKLTLRQTFESLGVKPDADCSVLTRDYVRSLRAKWLAEEGKRKGSRLSASTINHRLSMLSVLLETVDLPPHGVKHLSTKGNRRERRITDREVDQMISWLREHKHLRGALDLADLIPVALAQGARQGELLSLKWADVATSTLTLRDTKNSESRTIPIASSVRPVLEARRGLPGGPFRALTDDRITALWSQAREAIGLGEDEHFVFHCLRHEFASRLVDKGADAFTLMSLMGHANITTTQVYVKSSLGAMQRVMG